MRIDPLVVKLRALEDALRGRNHLKAPDAEFGIQLPGGEVLSITDISTIISRLR